MNPIDAIQSHYEEFTKNEKEIAIYAINNPFDIARAPIDAVAKITKTSKSAVIRFVQKVGYDGFPAFKYDMNRFLVSPKSSTPQDQDSISTIINTYIEYIQAMKSSIEQTSINDINKLILKAKRIKILGYNRTYHSASQLKLRLARIGIDSEAIHDQVLINDIVDILTSDDLCIVFTIADNGKRYAKAISELKSNGVPTVIFSCVPSLPIKKDSTHYLSIPRISRHAYHSFLDDQALFFILIEVLLSDLALKLQKHR